jgi:hypothetical protein
MRTHSHDTTGHTRRSLFHRQHCALGIAALLTLSVASGAAKIKEKAAPAVSSNLQVTAPLAETVKAVEEVASDPTVYGTYVYEHDKTLTGARQVDSSSAFGKDAPDGKVFYKVVDDVIAPRHFKDAEDSGTITVRYVVRAVGPMTVSIRVDAVFVESARRAAHASEGAVESAEFGQVQQHLNRIQARAKEAREEADEEAKLAAGGSAKVTQEEKEPAAAAVPEPVVPAAAAPILEPARSASGEASSAPSGSAGELEQRVNELRRQVEARVKAPGAALKSAPFHTATTIQTVPANAEVAVVILTTYWYGVQTTDGHTGWIQRSQLERLP